METIKTAVSVNKVLFDQAEELARELSVSRSRLYSLALEEYIRKQHSRAMLERFNAAYADELDAEEEANLTQMGELFRDVVEGEW